MNNFTFGLIKHDGVKRGITPSIIAFIIENGFNITEARWITLTQREAEKFCSYSFNCLEIIGNKVVKNCIEGGIDPRMCFNNDYDVVALGRMVMKSNLEYLTEGPMCFLGIGGVDGNTPQKFKDFIGKTNEFDKKTIRGFFRDPNEDIIKSTKMSRSHRNIIHGPDPGIIAFEKEIIMNAKMLYEIKTQSE